MYRRPRTLHVHNITRRVSRDRVEVSAQLHARSLGWHDARLWFDLPAAAVPDDLPADVFATALLLPAMAAGLALHVDGPVSSSLVSNLDHVQTLLTSWNARNPWARFRRIQLSASHESEPMNEGTTTGLFFTGGVDSLHALLTSPRELGHAVDGLLFVQGFDVPIDASALAASVETRLRHAAHDAGLPLHVVRTNLRQLTDPIVSWDMLHGAALAAAGHVASRGIRRWLISSSDAYLSDAVYGTAAALDPLWSRTGLDFCTAGLDLDRATKLEALVDEPLAHHHLIVCWQNRAEATNCGRCAKCVRTCLQLLSLDALDRFHTLPHRIDAADIRALVAEPVHRVFIWEDLARRLRPRNNCGELVEAIDGLVERSRHANGRPRLRDLSTRDGRRLIREWVRRRVQPRLPVRLRQRLLPFYRRRR